MLGEGMDLNVIESGTETESDPASSGILDWMSDEGLLDWVSVEVNRG
jgi:hypothetical protein